jgi:hypothetical protein
MNCGIGQLLQLFDNNALFPVYYPLIPLYSRLQLRTAHLIAFDYVSFTKLCFAFELVNSNVKTLYFTNRMSKYNEQRYSQVVQCR